MTLDSSPDAPQRPLAKPGYRDDVQGLRALAVILVVLYHAGFGFHGGFVGVDAFFVLSGFVIARRLRWEMLTTGSIDVRDFMRRRVARILPAASLMIVTVLFLNVFFGPLVGRRSAAATALAASLFNANNLLAFRSTDQTYFDRATQLDPFLHMWSLSVEEQFYLVFPFVVLATAWFARRSQRSASSLLALVFLWLGAVSFGSSLVAIGQNESWAFYLAPFRAWEFLAGAMVVWLEGRSVQRNHAQVLGVLGLCAFLGCSWFFSDDLAFPGVLAVLPVAATAMLLAAGIDGQTQLQTVLGHRLPSYIGRISYAWYLWHWPFIVFAKANFAQSALAVILAVVASFAAGALSTALFEEPLRARIATNDSAIRVAAAAVVVGVLTFIGAGALTSSTSGTASMQHFGEVFGPLGPDHTKCPGVADPEVVCRALATTTPGAKEVVLLGDSTALQLFAGTSIATRDLDANLTLAYRAACPTSEVSTTTQTADECKTMWDRAVADIEASPPDALVLSLSLDYYVLDTSFTTIGADGSLATTREERAAHLQDGVNRAVARLKKSVDDIVLVGATPKFPNWFPSECSFVLWSLAEADCGVERTWAQVNDQRREAIAIQEQLVRDHGVRLITFDQLLCSDESCPTNRGDRWQFKDSSHISVEQSRNLAPVLKSALRDLLR